MKSVNLRSLSRAGLLSLPLAVTMLLALSSTTACKPTTTRSVAASSPSPTPAGGNGGVITDPTLVSFTITITTASSSIHVTWNSVGGAPNYTVYRNVSNGNFSSLGPPGSGISYNDTGVSGTSTYCYYVIASNNSGSAVGISNTACGHPTGGTTVNPSPSGSPVVPTPPPSGSTPNVMSVTVNGSLCDQSNMYPNQPCASVKICAPGSTTLCQTINNILLDTGSYGLRIFSSVVTVPLTPVTTPAGTPIAECIQYGDGSSNWGPVQMANVVLGGEPATQVPIQLINSNFSQPPASCTGQDTSPAQSGYNGILGVGLSAHDCGIKCTTSTVGIYYACSNTTCTGTTVPLVNQVQNPVSLLPLDNNGVILELPSVPSTGATSITGSLILGIGTRTNNIPTGVNSFSANSYNDFITIFNGTTYSDSNNGTGSFIDSGSNALYFPSPTGLPQCAAPTATFDCPASATNYVATNQGATGAPSIPLAFQIGNFTQLSNTSANVFSNMGGNMSGTFDWGLPFFFGRDVYVGIENTNSSLGTGPYWAY